MQFWCPAPLPTGEEPRLKLRSDKYRPPATGLMENYESDSLVEADDDTDPEADDDVENCQDASSAAKPRRKTRVATAKQSATTAAAKVRTTKTTKVEAEKKKRKRRASALSAIETPTIPTPSTREIEDEIDEATDDPTFVGDQTRRWSMSPAAKRQWELEQKMSEDDLHQMREAQWATVGAQARMPVLVKVLPFRLVRYSCGTEVHSFVGSCIVLTWIYVGQMSNLRARWAHRIHLQGRGHQTMRPGLGLLLTTW